MCKPKSIRLPASVCVSVLVGVSALLPAQNLSAQCSKAIGDGPTGPIESFAHVGDFIHFGKEVFASANVCQLDSGTNWMILPDGTVHRVIDGYTHTCGQPTDILCPGGLGCGGDIPVVNGMFVYGPIQAADMGRVLHFTTPRGTIFTAPSGVNVPGGDKAVWIGAITDARSTDCANQNIDLASGQGVAHTTIISPRIRVTKACPPTCTQFGQPINFTGTVCNTGDTTLFGITVTNTVTGDGSSQITSFGATTSSGRPYNGSLTNGECVSFSGSETAPGNGCGPVTNTVLATATDVTGFIVTATTNAVCPICTTPCIDVTKTCPERLTNCFNGVSYVVSGIVTNCGNVPLRNVQVVDDNGTPGNPADDITIIIGDLAVNGSAPWRATNTANTCGPVTDTARASGVDICTGNGVQSPTRSCTTTIVCPPQICITKQVTCAPATGVAGCDNSLSYGPSATGAAGTNNPAFCYKIVVRNCGCDILNNVRVVDDTLGSSPPTVLATIGTLTNNESRTIFYGQSWGLGTHVNTATALGVGASSGVTVSNAASATVIVVPASVTCSVLLYSSIDQDSNNGGADGSPLDNHILLPAGTINAPITVTVTLNNTGQADLSVAVTGLSGIATNAVNCADSSTLAPLPDPVFIPAGGSSNVTFCIVASCPGGSLTVTAQGTAVASLSVPCIYDSVGRVIRTAPTTCPALVECQTPATCRVTGGGTLIPGTVDHSCIDVPTTILPAGPVKITHGGQLGAPYSQMDCGQVLANPCIRGQWQHTRHYAGTANPRDVFDFDFHSQTPKGWYDSLECACLGCCINGTFVPPSGPVKIHRKVICNPDDHKICGPLPAPSPANAIIFSGVGQLTPTDDTNTKTKSEFVVFRVYIEDRSEPGGYKPKGAVDPSDIYCFQAWRTGIFVTKNKDPNDISSLNTLRQQVAAANCDFLSRLESGALQIGSLPPADNFGNSRAADVQDCGPLYTGNHQIHPSTSAVCNP